jgi:hypothetical protein
MISTTLNDLIDDALGNTDREVEEVDTGWLRRVAMKAVRNLWSLCIRLNPDQFTKTSPTFTIASGNTHVIGTGATASIASEYLSPRSLEYDAGSGKFQPLRPYRFADRAWPRCLSYRIYDKTIDVQPTELATTYPLRLCYLTQPVFGDGSASFELPLGGDDVVIEAICAKIRGRYEESPDEHLTAGILAMQVVTRFLTGHDQGPPDQVPEAGDFLDDGGGW